MEITPITNADEKSNVCNSILRALPNWFGIESAIVDYVNDVKNMDTWVAQIDNTVAGFISINKHNKSSAEIHVIGILEQFHHQGIGKQLIKTVDKVLSEEGFKFLQVKTLSENRPDKYYDKTRQFYLDVGFFPAQEFKTLWGEHNPCLLLIKNIESVKNQILPNYQFPKFIFDSDLKEQPQYPEKWETFISELTEKLKNETDPSTQRPLLEYLGVACRIMNKLDESEKYLFRALSLSITLALPEKVIQNQIRLAHVYHWQKNFTNAKLLFDQAKGILNENEPSESLSAAYHQHLGKFYFAQSYYGNATCEFELALKIRKQSGSPDDQIDSSFQSVTEAKKRWAIKLDPAIQIRPAQVIDAEALHHAHMTSINQICSKAHTPDEIRVWGGRKYDPNIRIPAIQNSYCLVVEYDEQIEGFCQLNLSYKDGAKSAHLNGLYLTPKILNKKIGNTLINLILEHCQSEDVKVLTLRSTINAFEFYKKYGFKQTGELGGCFAREGVIVRGYPMKLELI